MNGIEVKNITKTFGSVRALHDVSVTIEPNKIYGLLGRNGAGKTTLLNIITTRIFADSGSVTIDDKDAATNAEAMQNVYMMSEKNYYPESMKVKEMFRWSKEFYPSFDVDYANSLAQKFELDTNKKFKALSTGYHSIVKVIIALAVGTDYVLLDEPVLGLDANHRELFYKLLIENYSSAPKTFVISTHLIEEAAGVIEDVIIIKKGAILAQRSCEEMLSESYTVSGTSNAVDEYVRGKEIIGEDSLGGLKTVYIVGKVNKSEIPSNLEIGKADLQKLFIRMTNEQEELR